MHVERRRIMYRRTNIAILQILQDGISSLNLHDIKMKYMAGLRHDMGRYHTWYVFQHLIIEPSRLSSGLIPRAQMGKLHTKDCRL